MNALWLRARRKISPMKKLLKRSHFWNFFWIKRNCQIERRLVSKFWVKLHRFREKKSIHKEKTVQELSSVSHHNLYLFYYILVQTKSKYLVSAFPVVRLYFISLLQKWCALSYKILINLLLNREPSLQNLLGPFSCSVFCFVVHFADSTEECTHIGLKDYKYAIMRLERHFVCIMHLHVEKSREINRCAAQTFFSLLPLFFSFIVFCYETLSANWMEEEMVQSFFPLFF